MHSPDCSFLFDSAVPQQQRILATVLRGGTHFVPLPSQPEHQPGVHYFLSIARTTAHCSGGRRLYRPHLVLPAVIPQRRFTLLHVSHVLSEGITVALDGSPSIVTPHLHRERGLAARRSQRGAVCTRLSCRRSHKARSLLRAPARLCTVVASAQQCNVLHCGACFARLMLPHSSFFLFIETVSSSIDNAFTRCLNTLHSANVWKELEREASCAKRFSRVSTRQPARLPLPCGVRLAPRRFEQACRNCWWQS